MSSGAGVSVETVLQMASALPAGRLVDEVVVSALRSSSARDVPQGGGPCRTSVSAAAVSSLLALDLAPGTGVPEVFVGLRRRDAAAVLAAGADRAWERATVLLNPVSWELPATAASCAPLFPACALDPDVVRVMCASFPFLNDLPQEGLEVFNVLLESSWSHAVVGRGLARQWAWGRAAPVPVELPSLVEEMWRACSPEAFVESPAARRSTMARHVAGLGSSTGSYVKALLAEEDVKLSKQIVSFLEDGYMMQPAVAGGASLHNAWLDRVVEESERVWLHWLRPVWDPTAGRPVVGRVVGRRLYEVTGEDFGLWTVALDLLERWSGPMQGWLDAVDSLR